MLNLAGNALSGSIPPDMANLLTLGFLDLSNNSLSGEIPPLLGRVVPLQYLLLNNNNLTGSLPNSLGNLASLTYLDLSSNSLSGSIPPSITNLSSLQVLDLSFNNLVGRLPEEIGLLTSLEFFQVSENGLSGPVPLSLYSISSLQTLSMAYNQLSGTLPLDIGDTLPNLSFLGMASNRLEGQIPWSLANATSLRQIDLSRNNFSGRVPANLGNLPYLKQVSLGNNSLEARYAEDWEFITSLTNCSQLEELSLIENDLGGVLPASIANLSTQLKSLTLGRNHISGSFPPGIRSFVNLVTLSLNENHFTGSIPDFLGEHVNLEALVLHGNRFSVLLLLFALFMTCWYERKQKKLGLPAKVLPTRLSYLKLMKATDGFSSDNLLGVGSYGSVYRGVLGDGKTLVAIKVLNLVQRGAFKAFVAECEALRNIRHRNLVKILTTCASVDLRGNEFRAIVFDFMPNGSLESWLHPDTDRKMYSERLSLLQRLDIAIDVAAAVSYLHDHCETPIIHCDLKPSNVLLDGNMTARVGDFGLARFLSDGTDRYLSSSVAMKGSIGYMAPGFDSCGCLQLRSAAAGAVHREEAYRRHV
ncbi:hypothetical protein BHM03_00015744 [Ensete ventricosum]|uniref:Protein kinase domain-containing protein n=1 Tax=Ensete ventricosum TaxID=4639 RepID=A0A445MEP7_ENSVE|nr:hypothetical protein BHM03_00015744 [Ensete ventricosum]